MIDAEYLAKEEIEDLHRKDCLPEADDKYVCVLEFHSGFNILKRAAKVL